MGGQERPQFQEPVRQVEVGQPFHPFEGKKAFSPVNLRECWESDETVKVLEVPIEFQGIQGAILLTTAMSDMITQKDVKTPLGKVRSIAANENGKVTIEEVPLWMGIEFEISQIDQLRKLEQLVAEVNFGPRKVYYLDCVDKYEDIERLEKFLEREKKSPISTSVFLDKEGWDIDHLLPYDIQRLASITVRIIPRQSVFKD